MNFIDSNRSQPEPAKQAPVERPEETRQARHENDYRRDYAEPRHSKVESLNKMQPKNIKDISTLRNGDRVVDHDGNERYVIGVDSKNNKVLMTGKNIHISDYKKTYTWSDNKFQDAVRGRGFRLAK